MQNTKAPFILAAAHVLLGSVLGAAVMASHNASAQQMQQLSPPNTAQPAAAQQAAIAQAGAASQNSVAVQSPRASTTTVVVQSATAPQSLTPKNTAGLPPDIFRGVLDTVMPLSPPQVKEIARDQDKIKRVRVANPGKMPTPISQSIKVSLAPGRAAHVVRLSANMVTNIVFTDVTGAPWPIKRLVLGNESAFGYPTGLEASVTNILPLYVIEEYGTSNLSVLLEGAAAPIVMTLLTGQKEVDFRLDMNVQGRGPNAKAPVLSVNAQDTASAPTDLVSILDGIPPAGSVALVSSDSEVQGWSLGGRVFVRAKMNLASPRALKAASSADGTRVYEIQETPSLLFIANGNTTKVRLSGFPPPAVVRAETQK